MNTEVCKHPQFINLRCICCSRSKKECGSPPTKPFDYLLPRLSLSLNEITRLRDKNLRTLIIRKKLQLILDLDNTLVHCTKLKSLTLDDQEYIRVTQRERKVLGDAYIHEMVDHVHVLKKRPGTTAFLKELTSIFDISIYTMGCRGYAKLVANILEPNKGIIKSVISREDCTTFGLKGLDVVLSHERIVLIVDDLSEVWRNHTANLVQIGAYTFFGSQDLGVEKLVECESWCTMDKELARVLDTLRMVHNVFYGDNSGDYESKDVRDVLKSVIKDDKASQIGDISTLMISERDAIPCNVNSAMQLPSLSAF